MIRRVLVRILVLGVLAAGLAACGSSAPLEPPQPVQTGLYRLGPGDALRIIVFGEEQLSGQFAVDAAGNVEMPLVGEFKAVGDTPDELSHAIAARLDQGYVKDAKVNVEVTNFRPFYILGEVTQPGRFAYQPGMTVITAVAMAGGYTYRGNQDYVLITRGNDPSRTERRAPINAPIFPDDVIRIPERYF